MTAFSLSSTNYVTVYRHFDSTKEWIFIYARERDGVPGGRRGGVYSENKKNAGEEVHGNQKENEYCILEVIDKSKTYRR